MNEGELPGTSSFVETTVSPGSSTQNTSCGRTAPSPATNGGAIERPPTHSTPAVTGRAGRSVVAERSGGIGACYEVDARTSTGGVSVAK